jgi:hypothetical protein
MLSEKHNNNNFAHKNSQICNSQSPKFVKKNISNNNFSQKIPNDCSHTIAPGIAERVNVQQGSVPYLSSVVVKPNTKQNQSTYNISHSNLNHPQQSNEKKENTSSFSERRSKSIDSDLIDLTAPVTPSQDMYSSDIDFMNNYLKSLPDYNNPAQFYNQPAPTSNFVKHKEYVNYYQNYPPNEPKTTAYHQQQQVQMHQKQNVPISKSSSMHTFSKRNIQTVQNEKETFSDVLKNKISKSTSSSTIPYPIEKTNKDTPIESPKKSSNPFLNIFKNLNSQKNQNEMKNSQPPRKNSSESSGKKSISDFWRENITSSQHVPKFGWNYQKITQNQPKSPVQINKIQSHGSHHKSSGQNVQSPVNTTHQHTTKEFHSHSHQPPQHVNVKSILPPSPLQKPKNVQNIVQQQISSQSPIKAPQSPLQKVRNAANITQNSTPKPQSPLQKLRSSQNIFKAAMMSQSPVKQTANPLQVSPIVTQQSQSQSSQGQSAKVVTQPSNQKKLVVQKLEQAVPNKAVLSKKDDQEISIKSQSVQQSLNKLSHNTEILNQQKPHYKIRKNLSHSQIDKKMKDNVVLTKEELLSNQTPLSMQQQENNKNQQAQFGHDNKLQMNNYVYMNQNDPNYFKNLHKITKNLDNATTNMILKPSLYKSISNSCVPSYMTNSSGQHFYYNPGHTVMIPAHQYPHPQHSHPHNPQYPPVTYKIPQEHYLQHSGSKSHIPVLFKYPVSKSNSNTSLAIGPPPLQGTTVGFYSIQDKPMMTASGIPLYWPAHINKSSSSSCIYAKTLSQPAYLSKNNDIFSRYKPIDDEEDEDEDDEDSIDDDISKMSNISGKSNISSATAPISSIHPTVNKPFMLSKTTSHQHIIGTNIFKPSSGSNSSVNCNYNNYPPFTKISSIQIPINGQLPPAFSKDKNNNIKTIECKNAANDVGKLIASESAEINNSEDNIEQSIADIYNVGNNYLRNSNRASVKGGKPINNNIFYGFGNQQQNSQDANVFTPYTKYLSDRKYFDMQYQNQVVNSSPLQQKRNIGTSTTSLVSSGSQTSKTMIPTFKDKVKTVNSIGMKPDSNVSEKSSLLPSGLCFQNNPTCTGDKHEEPINSSPNEYTVAANPEPPVTTSTKSEKVYNDADILSTFDPYYMPTTVFNESKNSVQEVERSSANNLHKLLSTVSEQWNNINNDDFISTGVTLNNSNSNNNSTDNYGTDQYSTSSSGCIEVHSSLLSAFYLLFHYSFFTFLL